jgi:hypothetical protein
MSVMTGHPSAVPADPKCRPDVITAERDDDTAIAVITLRAMTFRVAVFCFRFAGAKAPEVITRSVMTTLKQERQRRNPVHLVGRKRR